MRRSTSVLLAAMAFTAVAPASAQIATGYDCPRGLKFAAGACVRECPAGYADNGRRCDYKSLSGGGGK